ARSMPRPRAAPASARAVICASEAVAERFARVRRGAGAAPPGRRGKGGGEGTGQAVKVAGPKGNASVGGAAVSGGTISDASRVVAGMRAGFRACYNRALQENPDAQGSIRL